MNCNLWVLAIGLLASCVGLVSWQLRALKPPLTQLLKLLEAQQAQDRTAKPPPAAGTTFALSDAELAARERQLTATSRQRAQLAEQDARQRSIRMFHRG